jgi:hypothetical protein
MTATLHSSLESKVQRMNEALASLSTNLTDATHGGESDLLIIIRRPGWTTPAEAALVESLVETITEHATTLARAHQSLIKGALAVGQSE